MVPSLLKVWKAISKSAIDNGPVTLTDVVGSAVAPSLNGTVTASMRRVTPQKAMSFTSLNGQVDVTLPGDTKANRKVRRITASLNDFTSP